ncbi:hypothetical protein PO909_013839 [Leuciscus waleckii]
MMRDEYLVECNIDDDDVKKFQPSPPPPPQFSSTPPLAHVEIRDPYGVNKQLKVNPASTHSYDRVWVYSGIAFESTRLWGYRCLTALCAVPLSCLCGCLFALLACMHIWCVMPCIQVCHTCLPCVRSLWMSVVNIFITPFCTSVARCCSGIYVTVSKE